MLNRAGRSVFAAVVLALAVVVAIPVVSPGQTFRGGINGVVTDSSGAVVPGATVEAVDQATSVSHKTVSSSAGAYVFQDMPLGAYTVTVKATGFRSTVVTKVPVTAGVIYTLPISLAVATTGETVEVSASGLALDTTTTTQTTNIPELEVQDIPLNGRDFTQMIGLAPGFAGYSLGGYGSVNGTRANQINWQIDGADNNDWWHNIPAVNQGGVENIAGVTLPIDSVAEFSLQTQSSSEVGRNPGGTVNLVTKSGTNGIHGTAYYYERNQALAVTNPFNTLGDLPLTNVQWGASLGGPFWKDHTFWFANFEKQKFNIATGNSGYTPDKYYSDAAYALLAGAGVTPNAANSQLVSILWPANLLTYDKPGSQQSPAPEFGYSYNGVAKIDHTFNQKHNLSGRAFLGQGNQTAPVGQTDINPWFFEIGPIHVYNYSVADNYVFNPHLTNSLTIGVNYFNQTFSDANTNFKSVADAGFITGSPFDNAPNIKISGFEPTGNTAPAGRNDITGHLDDAVNWIVGKHQLRLGGSFRHAQVNEFYWRHSTGTFSFVGGQGPKGDGSVAWDTDDPNVASLADFLAGYLTKGSIAVGDPERTVYSLGYNLFAQDSYQLTSQLNLNFGLRYDFVQPMHDDKKDLSVFRPGLTTTGIAFQGADISSIYDPDYTMLSPRIGFSYEPSWSKGTVIRAGVGLFFDTPNANPFLDNRPGNSAPNGLEGNPGGPNPVYTLTTGAKTIVPGEKVIGSETLTCTDPSSPCGVFSVVKGFRSPYNYNFSMQMEKSLGGKASFQLGYVGSQGRKLLSLRNINQPYLGGAPGLYSGDGTMFGGNYYSDVNQIESIGTSNYNSLQAVFRTNAYHGVTSQISYTWGHNLDEVTAYRGALPQDSYNFKGDYGNSDFDTRNSVVGYVNYDIPQFKGPKLLTAGWALNTAYSFKGGQPITIYNGDDTSGTNEYSQRVNQIADPFSGIDHKIIDSGGSKYVQWFNPNAFVEPPANTWGTIARNSIFGPGFADIDLSVLKSTNFNIHDFPINAQFRAEMYNLFNRTNLASPACTQLCNDYFNVGGFGTTGSTIGSGNFSPGIGPGEPFNVQLALKLIF
jgi:Carboxypeptidase regulatory-like domain/TonB dependent receptor